MGWLYTRLVASNSFAVEDNHIIEDDGQEQSEESRLLSPQHQKLDHSIRDFMAMCVDI